MNSATTWSGTCHCGAVRFEVTGPLKEITRCDCSLCRKRNAVMTAVPVERFRLVSDWDGVSEYRWNTGVARHYFCAACGIYTFHRKRSDPGAYGVNVFCLDGFDPDILPTRHADGRGMTITDAARGDGRDGPSA